MATISASLVQELRKRTDAGILECKNALVAADGDIDKAAEEMRKAGLAKADKKSSRVAAEGVIVLLTSDDQTTGVIVEINSETDFVARDANFVNFANEVANCALINQIESLEELLAFKQDNGKTIDESRKELIGKIGENINIRRIKLLSANNGLIAGYLHGSKIGVLISMTGGSQGLAKDIAMHIAASNPMVVKPEQVSAEIVEKEKEIFTAQARESGKPDNIIEKMIAGRINKFLSEVSLEGQPFVKNPDETVGKLLSNHKVEVNEFVRFQVGEGIEKKEENFAAEVMAQVKGK